MWGAFLREKGGLYPLPHLPFSVPPFSYHRHVTVEAHLSPEGQGYTLGMAEHEVGKEVGPCGLGEQNLHINSGLPTFGHLL